MESGRYGYEDLRKAANSGRQEDIDALGSWFERYGNEFWNGEFYDADGMRLFPVYKWNDETDQGELIGYEAR